MDERALSKRVQIIIHWVDADHCVIRDNSIQNKERADPKIKSERILYLKSYSNQKSFYLWNMVLQGSGAAGVVNSGTTNCWAAQFLTYEDD